jgi:drug/metabolite transporter (DMT)-like permease
MSQPTRLGIHRSAMPFVFGVIGVACFSMSLPATRLAVRDLDPVLVAMGRAVVAVILATVCLWRARVPLPDRATWVRLTRVTLGVVIGFPLCTSIALQTVPSAHGAVVIALLPLATALAGVRRTGERPSPAFWAAAVAGALIVVAFSLRDGWHGLSVGDAWLVAAVLLATVGYVEGGMLSTRMPGWQVIAWALVVGAPVTVPISVLIAVNDGLDARATSWIAFAYLGVVSMFLGFFAWYRALATGGIARISQVQLIQAPLSLVWAALVVGEQLDAATVLTAVAVVACIAAAQRARIAGTQQRHRAPARG